MKMVRIPKAILAGGLLYAGSALGQTPTTNAQTATNAVTATIQSEAARTWSFGFSAHVYMVPDSREYVQPTLTIDRGWLHLEGRYNYEALDTGSVWIGYNFGIGDTLKFTLTPMLGGVFGDTTGIAPGYKASLSWWKLALYTEGEYLFDTGHTSDNFFYTWSELSLAPTDWFRFGGVVQRTKLYETEFDIQRGFLVGFSYKNIDLTGYIFNPFEGTPTFVIAAGVSF